MLELPVELQATAERELNETPEKRTSAMAELRQLLDDPKKNPKLHRQDDAFLLMYLRHAKFDAKKALARLQSLARWMQTNAALLGDWSQYSAEDFRELYGVGFMKTIEGHSRDGALVMMILPMKLKAGDIKDPNILLKWSVWTLHQAVHDPYLQVSGQLIIETFQGMSFFQAINFGRSSIPQPIMKQNMAFMSQCAPYRLKGIWIFHQTSVMSVLMAIVRPFLSRKMKQRIRVFGPDFSELHEQVDPAKLPAEFGGSAVDDGWGWFNAMKEQEAKEAKEAKEAGV